MHNPSVFAFAKTIVRSCWRPPPRQHSAVYLQSTPPHASLKHAAWTNCRTGYQPASRGSRVSQFLRLVTRVPWVSWLPSMAITFLGAAFRPSYSTQRERPYRSKLLRFQGANLEDPLTVKRLLVPSPLRLFPRAQVSASTLSKLTGKPSRAFHG